MRFQHAAAAGAGSRRSGLPSRLKAPRWVADGGGVWSFFSSSSSNKPAHRREMRAAHRFTTDLLTTDLGKVVDISASGVRVRCEGRPPAVGQVATLKVRSIQHQMTIRCRVVRVVRARQRGAKGYDVSLAFVENRPGLKSAIEYLGQFGFIPRGSLSDAAPPPPPVGEPPRPARPAADRKDYYAVLEVSAGATHAQIRQAYHRLARQCHPDVARDPKAAERFEALAEAYKVLRDPKQRRTYDESRRGHAA